MNINLMRLRPVVKELRAIRDQLERLADCWEVELAEKGYNMRPPKTESSDPEPTVEYIDEEMDWARETLDRIKREEEQLDGKEEK